MRARSFLSRLQHEEIVAAIKDAEKRTSGEIRVFISRKAIDDPVREAEAHFVHLGMQKTRERNGVLIFVAPRTHKFAVIGDVAVHARCGPAFWQELADGIKSDFGKAQFTRGIVQTVKRAGELLQAHFPRKPDDKNELPDTIAHD